VSIANQTEPRPPSKTAIWTATSRAIGAKHPEPEFRNPDYLAIAFVGPAERALLPDLPMEVLDLEFPDALARMPVPGFVTRMFARTRFFDAALEDALRDGVRQVVILGAGLDSRGYRFADRLGGVRFFEVDSPASQAYKQQRVREALGALPVHVRYVPVDFATDDLLAQLGARGYTEDTLTLFVWEGVTQYLPEVAVQGTLRFVRDHAAPGSTLAFEYYLSSHPLVNNSESLWARWGEPWIFGFPGESAAAYVEREGLTVENDLSAIVVAARYARRSDGTWALPAVDPSSRSAHSGYCVARVP
jgi:methyltransferase (TIGR00027 family)